MPHTYESALLFEEIVKRALDEKHDVPATLASHLHELYQDAFVSREVLGVSECLCICYTNKDISGYLGFNGEFRLIVVITERPRPAKYVLWHYPSLGFDGDDGYRWREVEIQEEEIRWI